MDHAFFEENHVPDRYVMGQLTVGDRLQFEEHFVDCPDCQQQLETARGFRAGFRAIAAETQPPPPIPAFRPYAWLAAGLLLAGMPAAWLGVQSSRLGHELEQEKTASAEWKKRFDHSEQVRKSLTQVTIPVYALNLVRGADNEAAPALSLVQPSEPRLLVLLLENPVTPDYLSYQATITASDGRTVWQARDLAQNAADNLAVSFSSDLTPPGNYLLTLVGNTRDGRALPVALFRFRVFPPK